MKLRAHKDTILTWFGEGDLRQWVGWEYSLFQSSQTVVTSTIHKDSPITIEF